MSDTPWTDEEVETAKKFQATSHGLWVSAEFARHLERELRAYKAVHGCQCRNAIKLQEAGFSRCGACGKPIS